MAGSKLADYLLENPLYAYGRNTQGVGMSTAPVQTPMEGLARALQGGISGLAMGYGMAQAKEEQTADQSALAKAMEMYGTNPDEARKVLATRPNLAETASSLLMNDVNFKRQIDLLQAKDKIDRDAQRADMIALGIMPPTNSTTGGAQPTFSMPPEQAKAEAQNKIKYLVDNHGMNPQQAAMMVGNLYQESGFNPNAVHDNGTGFGMGGWRLERRDALLNAAKAAGKNPSDPQFQLDFYANEFKGRPEFQQFQQARTPQEQQAALMTYFRPAGWTPQTPQAGLGYNNRIQYGQTFAGQGGGFTPTNTPAQAAGGLPQVQAGDMPPGQVAEGDNAQPRQTALNAPAGGAPTINFQGVDLPRAEVAAAMMIRDQKARQEKLADIVRNAVKTEKGPDAGTTAGDVAILNRALKDPAFALTPEYHAAHNRAFAPQMSQNGQLLYPDSSAYPKPVTERGQTTPTPRLEETPGTRFDREKTFRDDFNGLKPVKDYREVVPIFESMQDAATRNNSVSDLNLVYGLAKIMDPTSVVREGEQIMVRNAQSLPSWLQGMISAANGGSHFPQEQRSRILAEASSRVGAYKQQYDGYAGQYGEMAQRYGLDPRNIINAPLVASGQGGQGGQPGQGGGAPAAGVPVYDMNAKRIK